MNLIREKIKNIKEINQEFMETAQIRLDNLIKPKGSLGRLEELARLVAGIVGKERPIIRNKVIITMAADHGIVEEGVSAFPQEVTSQMVYNFLKGKAGINILSKHVGAKVVVVDMGVKSDLKPHPNLIIKKINHGTKNMKKGPAMTKAEAIRSIEAGIEVVEAEFKKGVDIIGTGDMGIGNTTPSSAITALITGEKVEKVTGKGTGIAEERLNNKIRVIKKAIDINRPNPEDPVDILSKIGGFEIGGLAGVIIEAAALKIPVVIDGFISGAAALVAFKIDPRIKHYIIASHLSFEPGHRNILNYLGLKPLLNLDLRLGEGTGAALGIGLVEAGVKIFNEMATFEEAGVSK
jgi:nicotinate-nucleotide--dimethylbenzimidazole phosphoribosyltransferase